jgi:hypothetical protein
MTIHSHYSFTPCISFPPPSSLLMFWIAPILSRIPPPPPLQTKLSAEFGMPVIAEYKVHIQEELEMAANRRDREEADLQKRLDKGGGDLGGGDLDGSSVLEDTDDEGYAGAHSLYLLFILYTHPSYSFVAAYVHLCTLCTPVIYMYKYTIYDTPNTHSKHPIYALYTPYIHTTTYTLCTRGAGTCWRPRSAKGRRRRSWFPSGTTTQRRR